MKQQQHTSDSAVGFRQIQGSSLKILSCSFLLAALLAWNMPTAFADEQMPVIPRFDIVGYYVQGNTLFPNDQVMKLLTTYTGRQKDFGTVQQALEALQDAYRDRGYTTVHVLLPEQELEQGVVRLKVIEGKLQAVRVEGNRHFNADNIRRSFPSLAEGSVPDIGRFSASLGVANDNPAKKTTLQLQSGDSEEEIIAHLKVKDESAWKIGLSIDNTGTSQTGDWRTGLLFQHANVFNLDHVLTLQYTTAPEKPSKVKIYSAGYRIPLYGWGDSIDLFGGYSDVDSGNVMAGVLEKVTGKGILSGIRYNQNLARIGAFDHRFVYGFDYRIYENNYNLLGTPQGNDVAVHPLSLTYAGDWKPDGMALSGYVTFVHNIPGGNMGENADFQRIRANAPAAYSLLRYGASLGLTLPGDWQERLIFNGQYTDNELVPGEQFGLGGASSVRGFPERDLAGDWGHFTSQEIYTPDFARLLGYQKHQLRLLAFYDFGHLVRVRPAAGDTEDTFVSAAGLGLRLAADKHFTLSLDYGIVVHEGGSRDSGDDRLHLKATLVF